jgi:hypothetical protein
VARYKLGLGLAEASPYLLLLTATPHQGKTDSFYRLVSLLDRENFPDPASVTRERVQPHIIRTEKRRALDAQGQPLFKPRQTKLVPIAWEERHRLQGVLYEAVTQYVRDGYNQALMEKRNYVGFLLLLMQRLVTSSTRAIGETLVRRQEVLQQPEEQLTLFPLEPGDDWPDLDGQEQLERLLRARLKALKNERAEVGLLLEAARRTEAAGPDAKAEALLDWLYRLQQEEQHPELKVLIFTEFLPTQEMLAEFLRARGFSVACLNGAMDMAERQKVQTAFAGGTRILVSTEAGGEGLNLQFCHVVINYDLPWNPMRLEQRIGRVDRIGQESVVRALNFILEDTVEFRVQEVLEEKLAVILREFGVDKTSDVLDSAEAGAMFEEVYREAVLDPRSVETQAHRLVEQVREEGLARQASAGLLGSQEDLEPGEAQRLLAHPLPHWVERMTVSYVQAHGGQAERRGRAWAIRWPDGKTDDRAVFSVQESRADRVAGLLNLENPRIRELVQRLPRFAPGQPLSVVTVAGLPPDVKGTWSLWQVVLAAAGWNRQRILAIFLHDDGRVLTLTARFVWDQFLADGSLPRGVVTGGDAANVFQRVAAAAERAGRDLYEELRQKHQAFLARERDRGQYAFAARRRLLDRIGLPEVREYRQRELAAEEREWQAEWEAHVQTMPELWPIIVVRVEGGADA